MRGSASPSPLTTLDNGKVNILACFILCL
jgi:hypothetical protein